MSDDIAGYSPPGAQPPKRENSSGGKLKRYFARFDDGEILRWAFRGLLLGSIGVLAMDLREMSELNASAPPIDLPSETASPLLPPAFELDGPLPTDPRTFLKGDQAALRQPMRFTLEAGGVLLAEGAIDPGASDRLVTELNQRGEYVQTVSLNSPGGALDDAMAMAKVVRDRKLSTEVADGALCASSCPLLFAGGSKRLAGTQAAIGVHQFFVTQMQKDERRIDAAEAMSDAQITTARISRHLQDMGIDPALWLHAMDTPPQSLYYFSPKELASYRLVTGVAKPRSEAIARSLRLKPAT